MIKDLFAGVVPFVATAQARSFGRAARELSVTPSALSKAIAKLEADVGVRLLNRTSRSVSLTAEGAAFLERCRTAVDQVSAAREIAAEAQSAPRGLLRVSLPVSLGSRVIVPALARLLTRHPGLEVQVRLTDRYVDLVRERVDAVVRIGKLPPSRAVARRLRSLRWVTVASPGYLASHGTPATPRDLARHDCLRLELATGTLRAWELIGGRVAPAGSLVADNGEALVEAAVAGAGILQAHDYMVASALGRGQLVEILGRFAAPGPIVSLLLAPGRRTAPKVRAFADLVVDLLGD
jgi:LysR family transcriptional regulator, regulator for bpeEF and oprC